MSTDPAPERPEAALVAAVAMLHDRGLQGVRIAANFYATGHWRCRVYVPHPGDATGPGSERDVLLSYSNGAGWDVFGDGRSGWTPGEIADRLAAAAAPYPLAVRSDEAYATWLRALRARTNGGWFVMYEDAYTPEEMWERRGVVRLVYGDRETAAADRRRDEDRVDMNGWSLAATMPVPPPP